MRAVLLLGLLACGGPKDADDRPDDTGPSATPTTTGAGTTTDPTTATPPRDWCPPLALAPDQTLSPGDDVQAALDGAAPGTVIALSAGTYTLDIDPLRIATDGVALIGATGDADDVVVDGTFGPSDLVLIQASDVTLAHLTVKRSFFRGVRVSPPDGVSLSGVRVHGVVVEDPGAEAIRVEADGAGLTYADDGMLTCNTLRLTELGRDRTRVACDVGGIGLERTRGWTVSDNVVEGFWCADRQARPAIFAGVGSRDTEVERNQVRDCAIGVQLGEGTGPVGRRWDDAPCAEGDAQHYGGMVRNNMVVAIDGGLLASSTGFAAGVALQSACDTTVLHNTIYSEGTPSWAAVEFSHPTTTGITANNLTTHGMARRDDAPMVNESNLENAEALVFLFPSDWDVHLNPGTTAAVDEGSADYLDLCGDDIDGQLRDGAPDMGADELRAL